jgi:extracellular elastinolytic metalloproteinase
MASDLDREAATEVALDHLRARATELGIDAAELDDMIVTDFYTSRHSGTTHVYLTQSRDGILVHQAQANVAIAENGSVARVSNRLIPLKASSRATRPALSAEEAVGFAAQALELAAPEGLTTLEALAGPTQSTLLSAGGISRAPIPAHLVYYPISGGDIRLAWNLEIQHVAGENWWSATIDAETGRLLDVTDFVDVEQYATYEIPIESPHHTTPLPPADSRSVAVDPYLATTASPFGWHDTDGSAGPEFTITRGNNTHTYLDTDANNAPDTGANAEPDGGVTLDFTGALVTMDLSMEPDTYPQASAANLFYWTNIIHDVMWNYGFDEASGNFQVNNYGNGGLGSDDVQAEAQDGAGNCNANFGTPADGSRPRMQMFTCTNTTPARDGAFDHGVVIHEYGHGISNRLTGGPSQAGCLSVNEQMGEGWSDYFGLMLTMEPGDLATDARGTGTWLFGQGPAGAGIRPAPYSTDLGVNNFTYSNVGGVSIPHGVGFIWATMVWDMTWELIADHGFNPDIYDDWTTGGNNLALQLVMDGLKLQPCSPGFVDGRDAILAADDLLTGDGTFFSGANQCAIWDGFDQRGLGYSADQGSSNSVTDGTPAFDMPPACATIGAPIDTQTICQGDVATYRIGVGTGFTAPPVTLSSVGEPAGTTVTFTPNPVVGPLPTLAEMTVSNTAAAVAGTYNITVTGTDTTPTALFTGVTLDVYGGVAAGPALSLPADGATDEVVLPTFEWLAVAGAPSYTLELDDDPAFGSIDYAASGLIGTSHTISAELDYATTYYWRVRGDNPCGAGTNSAAFSFSTAAFPGACPVGTEAVIHFQDDLESGAAGWTSSGTGDTWGLSGARYSSPVNSFFAVDPPTLSDQRLVSPPIVLPAGAQNLTLQFENYQAFETPNGDGRCWDAGILEVTTNGGSTWSKVPQASLLTDPYDNILWNDTAGNNPISTTYGATLAWCDELQPFTTSVVDASAYAGNTAQFRWRLGSDSAAGNEGWYIDDVVVQSCVAPFFADGFESGDTTAWSASFP